MTFIGPDWDTHSPVSHSRALIFPVWTIILLLKEEGEVASHMNTQCRRWFLKGKSGSWQKRKLLAGILYSRNKEIYLCDQEICSDILLGRRRKLQNIVYMVFMWIYFISLSLFFNGVRWSGEKMFLDDRIIVKTILVRGKERDVFGKPGISHVFGHTTLSGW